MVPILAPACDVTTSVERLRASHFILVHRDVFTEFVKTDIQNLKPEKVKIFLPADQARYMCVQLNILEQQYLAIYQTNVDFNFYIHK